MELPLRPAEAAELANLIFDRAEGKTLSDDVRNRLAARAAVLKLQTISPFPGSLERDPVHRSVYYLAVDGTGGAGDGARVPLLLHMALAAAPTSSIQADAQQEEEDEVLFLQHGCLALCGDIRYGRLEPAGHCAFGLLIQPGYIGLEVPDGFVDGVAAEEEDAYDGEKRNDDGGGRSHGGFLSIEQNLDDAHDLSDNDDLEKQQSP